MPERITNRVCNVNGTGKKGIFRNAPMEVNMTNMAVLVTFEVFTIFFPPSKLVFVV